MVNLFPLRTPDVRARQTQIRNFWTIRSGLTRSQSRLHPLCAIVHTSLCHSLCSLLELLNASRICKSHQSAYAHPLVDSIVTRLLSVVQHAQGRLFSSKSPTNDAFIIRKFLNVCDAHAIAFGWYMDGLT